MRLKGISQLSVVVWPTKTFVERIFREVKNSRNVNDILSGKIINDAPRENLTLANVYFKC